MGWCKGHAGRDDGPFAVQDWCDRAAAKAEEFAESENDLASRYDTPFLLIDAATSTPAWGGWRSTIEEKVKEKQREPCMHPSTPTECSRWLQLRERWCAIPSEWDRLHPKARHGPAARGRINAQWDTVYGPGRWNEEQKARDKEVTTK